MSVEKKTYPLFKIILRIIPIQFKTAPWNCIVENSLAIIHGLSFSLAVIATQYLFDTALPSWHTVL